MTAKPHNEVHIQSGAAATAPLRVKVVRRMLRGIFRVVFRVRVQGLAHMPHTPAIICANHLGWTDGFLPLLFLPAEPRIYVLGEREGVLRNRFRVWLIDSLQLMIPLDRDQPREALRLMEDVLHRGGSLLLFPEGHLGTTEGMIRDLQPGAALLSLRTGTPIVPLGLTGTSDLWLRRPLTLRIGPPLNPAAFAGGPLRTQVDALTAALTAALHAQLPGDTARARVRPLRRWLTNLF